MSIKIVEDEVRRFLATTEPEILCITGAWGVGKTYAWDFYLKNAVAANKVALKASAYVSLFGQNSLQDVRSSLFESTRVLTPEEDDRRKFDLKTMAKDWMRRLSQYRSVTASISDGLISAGERLMFASVKDLIVCLDDLERAGHELRLLDILGLANQLKEEKRCKVVLLLNANELREQADDFERQIEKVADAVVSMAPTPTEAAAIGVREDAPHVELLRRHCATLGVTNIRVIRRIEAKCRQLCVLLEGIDERVVKQAMHSAALFIFSRYMPDYAPSIDFIRSYILLDLRPEQAEEYPFASDWRALLTKYEFGHVDEFDTEILEAVQDGHFNKERLCAQARSQQAKLRLQDQDNSFNQAWHRYHDSFDTDQDAVLDAMAEAFRTCVASISPLNASATVAFFKEFDREEQARGLAQYYVNHREELADFWNLDDYAFRSEVRDPDLIALFNQKYEATAPPLEEPTEVLLRINRDSGWNPRDVERLNLLSVEDFYDLFKRPNGRNLQRLTAETLRFRTRGPEGSPEHEIWRKADAALSRIAEESPMNARRVQHHRSRA